RHARHREGRRAAVPRVPGRARQRARLPERKRRSRRRRLPCEPGRAVVDPRALRGAGRVAQRVDASGMRRRDRRHHSHRQPGRPADRRTEDSRMSLPRPKRRVVIVDDHTLFREGLRTILEMEEDLEVVADAESAEDIVEMVWQTKPDILLLDIKMPQGSGLDAVPAVLRISPGTHVLVLTACDEKEEHVRAFKLGAKGVILKDSARQTLMQAIQSVRTGQVWVDPRMTGALVEEL